MNKRMCKRYFITVIVFCLQINSIHSKTKEYIDNNTNELTDNKTISTLDTIPRVMHHGPAKWISESSHFQRHRLSEIDSQHCQKPAVCQTLNYSHCMGVKLPYSSTTLDLIDLQTQELVQEKLYLYQGLKNVPKCWTVIQPFLCSLYMPKCENGKVDLPSKELCRNIFTPCKIFYNTTFFSDYMKCEDDRLFRPNCKNVVKELKFQSTGQCVEPLIETDSTAWFYEDIEGCGLRCKSPLYTDNEHNQIHKLVAWGAGTCLLFNAFTVITFMVDWKTANKYPALVIFYINCCFLVSCIGWLAQFYGPDSRDDIVCKKDGTIRMSEPSGGENLSCVIVFVLVYYFLMAGMVWFVILTYAWHMSFQALGKIQERIDKKRAYFHLVAWSLPLVLTITTMAIGEIDGDSISGICFVGYVNPAARAGLLLGPLGGVLIVGGYFLFRGLVTLIRLKVGSREIISPRASSKIRSTIVRMGLFSLLTLVFGITTFVCHIHYFMNEKQWRASLRSYILCRLTNSQADLIYCKQDSRPSVSMLQLHLLALFAAGIVMSSWVWTHATIEAWTRFIRRKFDCEIEEPVKLQKHKVIAQAFAKRKMLYHAGRLSITFHNTHTDPVGLNFDLNSVASHDLSSTWAAALPKLVHRRGALTCAATGSVSSQRRNSMDSEISFSVKRVSVESRRNSVDSQLSVQIAELKTSRKVNGGRRHRNRRRRRDFSSKRVNKTGPLFSRRESSTSLDSQLGHHLLNALAMGNTDVKTNAPNLKRRTASAGLDGQHINNLLTKGKLVVPFPIPGQSEDENASEDENVSLAVSESRFNMVLSGQTNEMVMKSLRKGLNIENLSTDETETKRSDRRPYSKSDRESRLSRRSYKKERRKSKAEKRKSEKYDTDYSYKDKRKFSDEDSSLTSFCPELSHLAVQSSLNSGISVGTQHNCEKNRASKQSKNSIDVGVQANAREIATQTQSTFDIELTELDQNIDEIQNSRSRSSKSQCVSQGTQMSPKSIRSSRDSAASPFEKIDIQKINVEKKNQHDYDEDVENNFEKVKKNKKKYQKSGSANEIESLHKNYKYSTKTDDLSYESEKLLNDNIKANIIKKKA